MSSLNGMPTIQLNASSNFTVTNGYAAAKITLTNDSSHIAFFLRA